MRLVRACCYASAAGWTAALRTHRSSPEGGLAMLPEADGVFFDCRMERRGANEQGNRLYGPVGTIKRWDGSVVSVGLKPRGGGGVFVAPEAELMGHSVIGPPSATIPGT